MGKNLFIILGIMTCATNAIAKEYTCRDFKLAMIMMRKKVIMSARKDLEKTKNLCLVEHTTEYLNQIQRYCTSKISLNEAKKLAFLDILNICK